MSEQEPNKRMTLAEQFREEGRRIGREEGRQIEIRLARQAQAFAIAKRLLTMTSLSPTQIAKAADLSVEEVFYCKEALLIKEAYNCNYREQTGAKLMTLAEQFRQEGREESIQKGVRLGIQKQAFASAKKLLPMNLLSPDQIAQAVGLSVDEVLRCKEEA